MTADGRGEQTGVRYGKEFACSPGAVRAIRDDIAAVARRCHLPEETVQNIRLAVSEAATNSIIHGRAPADAHLIVRVNTSGDELCIVIADQGHGMLPRDDGPGLGLGLPIMSTVAKRVEFVSPASTDIPRSTCTSLFRAHRTRAVRRDAQRLNYQRPQIRQRDDGGVRWSWVSAVSNGVLSTVGSVFGLV